MPITINTNVASLKTQSRLGEATSALQKSYERLSSGLRINSAADDAAGLSISASLDTDTKVYAQGVRNLNDGISLLNIAEGAVDSLTNIVTRIEELAEQAGNGTLSYKQRTALDSEAQALRKEYLRIAQTTEFNGKKLFDGTTGNIILQAGYGTNGTLTAAIGGKMGTGSFQTSVSIGSSIRSI